jgi:hypothetical protein
MPTPLVEPTIYVAKARQNLLVAEAAAGAIFTFGPGVEPAIWKLDAYVAPPLDSDVDFLEQLAQPAVDFQIEHGSPPVGALRALAGRPVSDTWP